MQISSTTNYRIPVLLQQPSSSDTGAIMNEGEGKRKMPSSNAPITSVAETHKSLEQALAASALEKAVSPESGATTAAANSTYSGQMTNTLDYLTPSDIQLLEMATGAKYENGRLVGGLDSADLQGALFGLRTWGNTSNGQSANPITGDVSADDLRASVRRMSGVTDFAAIDRAIALLEAKDEA